jgi:GT2 family glycosyltransferase
VKISVLIATRNRAEPLLRCLESVAGQRLRAHEIVVLDDASDEFSVSDMLAKAGVRDVRVVRSDVLLGVAAGRNRLYSEASGDVFFVLDDDAFFDDANCLTRVREILEAQPKTGIVAARIIDHRDPRPRVLAPFPQHRRRRDTHITERAQLVSYFLGGAHAIRREVYERTGGYHEDFVFGEEELDLSFRAIRAGYEITYSPSVVVQHHPMPSVLRANGRPRSELFYHVRNRLFLAKQYLPAAYIVPYLSIWLGRYAFAAVRGGHVGDFLGGLFSGLRRLEGHRRTPLEADVLSYLRRNHGRLWF